MIESSISPLANKLRIAGIVEESIVDGPGIRMTVFTQGCNHKCKGCHNPQTHDFKAGRDITIEEIIEKAKNNPLLDGLTISGGEPFEQAQACANLARAARDIGLNVLVYTGYTYEILQEKEAYQDFLQQIDILIDGRFEIDQMDLTLAFRGSKNQRIIELKNK